MQARIGITFLFNASAFALLSVATSFFLGGHPLAFLHLPMNTLSSLP